MAEDGVEVRMQGVARQFVRAMDAQIARAKAAGADNRDCCIVVPVSYLSLVMALPVVEVGGTIKAVTTIRSAEGMVRTMKAEAGWLLD